MITKSQTQNTTFQDLSRSIRFRWLGFSDSVILCAIEIHRFWWISWKQFLWISKFGESVRKNFYELQDKSFFTSMIHIQRMFK